MSEPVHPLSLPETPPRPSARQLAHDLRDCLHKIGLGIQILRRRVQTNSETDETFKMIEQCQKQACQLTEEFSRLTRDTDS